MRRDAKSAPSPSLDGDQRVWDRPRKSLINRALPARTELQARFAAQLTGSSLCATSAFEGKTLHAGLHRNLGPATAPRDEGEDRWISAAATRITWAPPASAVIAGAALPCTPSSSMCCRAAHGINCFAIAPYCPSS